MYVLVAQECVSRTEVRLIFSPLDPGTKLLPAHQYTAQADLAAPKGLDIPTSHYGVALLFAS